MLRRAWRWWGRPATGVPDGLRGDYTSTSLLRQTSIATPGVPRVCLDVRGVAEYPEGSRPRSSTGGTPGGVRLPPSELVVAVEVVPDRVDELLGSRWSSHFGAQQLLS
jgi:hypothetical protein